ncbi:uncharacterized protein GGS25DRAFT_493785 [Hypoxylon fragiforme]|uniref:uncharacterized protein n=1 Tax=Hypoxylon fragiforme TaxID=63214 RepID=UPI0020C61BCC|nr:uncharacterized protein GGS25DRAFT_493785 [Hypoxylon fragiforme]KAI2606915.1 hypothetical protein GGS25DRAFT_493785 [Hypoxylon fragiforme]
MVARHALTTASCSHCRLAVLKLFTTTVSSSSFAVASSITRPNSLPYRPRFITQAPSRAFSSQPDHDHSAPLDEIASDEAASANEGSEESHAPDNLGQNDAAKDSSSLANVPWYLQVEPPRHVASIEQPPLPEVPEGAPRIVNLLLEYISEELGLDELELLDLRELYPPAALGPNLFMLFGTARSERHLSVSAGRLQRWLRVKHRIYANADGLLGPNERKMKLRRKAKRAKLLGGVEDTDDGIQTGWICVNLGTINRGKDQSAVIADDGRVAGFGVSQNGHTVVVQIMTESRRAELKLETLWKQALGDDDEPIEQDLIPEPGPEPGPEFKPEPELEPKLKPKPEAKVPEKLHPLEEAILASSRPRTVSKNNNLNEKIPFQQTRFFSTRPEYSGEAPGIDPFLHVRSEGQLQQILTSDKPQKLRLLKLLLDRLDGVPLASARAFLGVTTREQTLTPFLRLYSVACQGLPPSQTWESRLAIQAKACESNENVPIQMIHDVRHLVDEVCLYGIEISRQQCLQLLSCIYCSDVGGLGEQTQIALQLLKTMQQRRQSVLDNDIAVVIIEAAARCARQLQSREYIALIQRLENVLLQANMSCMSEPLIMTLMQAYAGLRHWDGIWNAWRIPPRYLRSRSTAMYTLIYQLAVATRSPTVCTATLRRCFQEMLSEDPPVLPTGMVRKALVECINIADPTAKTVSDLISSGGTVHDKLASREFVKMLRSIQGF